MFETCWEVWLSLGLHGAFLLLLLVLLTLNLLGLLPQYHHRRAKLSPGDKFKILRFVGDHVGEMADAAKKVILGDLEDGDTLIHYDPPVFPQDWWSTPSRPGKQRWSSSAY